MSDSALPWPCESESRRREPLDRMSASAIEFPIPGHCYVDLEMTNAQRPAGGFHGELRH